MVGPRRRSGGTRGTRANSGDTCCARGAVSGVIPLAVWRPGGAWGGFASLIILADWPCSSASGAFAVAGYRPRPRPTDDAGREAWRRHGGGPTRGDAVTDLPLIKAAKLWAKVSARTGAAYLTGRWGGCRVLVFENLEHASEAVRRGDRDPPRVLHHVRGAKVRA